MIDTDAAIEQLPDDHPARDVSIVVEDGHPALDFGDGYKLQLRTHVNEWTHENPENGENVDMNIEVGADDHAWWTLYPERAESLVYGTDAFPEVVIEPFLIDGSESIERTETLHVDRVISDSSDLSMLGTGDIGEACVSVVGEPDDAGFLPEKAVVRGELEVFPYVEVDDGE